MRTIQNKLKEIRMKEYMLNQKDFAEFLGIKIRTYNMWERGESCPNLQLAFEICEKLKKDIKDVWYLQ
ncbi:helix-turn-helix domain-containing protein [uncultured Clostridium sp.]|uniref:helix-turn-helix transcriptional regulator n=1 Tax=uncultured Clostridium sp. TaxID=59620 RepID=UPI002623E13A|nr:helix-turn-helix domain-containing protein [uncultured Clostridium sp.]